jgi:hypothetical protein
MKMEESKFSNYVVTKPLREVGADLKFKGITLPTRTYMSDKLVPGSNTYIEISWIYEMPEPSLVIPAHHSHPYNEITMLIGSDPHNPESLGAEVESYLGGEKLVQTKSNVTFIPKGVEHGHLLWKKFERPHMMVSIMLGTGDFKKANPGALK